MMVEVSIQDQARTKRLQPTPVSCESVKVSAALPNKFATTAELNATRIVGTKDTLPGEVVVSAKLMYPDSLKKILKEDESLRDFARRLSREAGGFEDVARLLFLVFKGEASYAEAEDLRTLLDLQYFADMDVITVQQTSEMSPEDFASLLKFAQRWMDQKGIDKPIMPVIEAPETQREFELFSAPVVKSGSRLLGSQHEGRFSLLHTQSRGEHQEEEPRCSGSTPSRFLQRSGLRDTCCRVLRACLCRTLEWTATQGG